ncbi:6-phosphogluconate dehydrogenase [Echinicola sediminis]
MNKFVKIAIFSVVLLLAGFIYWKYFFVFAEGVKGGTLNYYERKGFIFKTWEGRLVQEGFQSPTAGALQSNEFRFSGMGEDVAKKLERASGKFVELRYREYLGTLPWRGASKYVVYEVVEIRGDRSGAHQDIPANIE